MNYRIAEKLCIAGAISQAASQTDSDGVVDDGL